jgi:inosine-uridine nucleoside N-ribohydrolase
MMMSFNVTNSIKVEDEDDVQKERRKLRNTKRAERRHRVVEQHQRGQGNLYDCSTRDLCTVINAGRDACNIIIARQQERKEVEVYSPTNYHIFLDYLYITWKCKPEAGEQPTQRKRILNSKKRFEEALLKQSP